MVQCPWHGLEALLVQNQCQRKLLQIARAVAVADRAGILLEGTVTNVVVAVFHCPMSATPLKQLLGFGPLSCHRSDAIHNLCARRDCFFENLAVALDTKGLAHLLEIECYRSSTQIISNDSFGIGVS